MENITTYIPSFFSFLNWLFFTFSLFTYYCCALHVIIVWVIILTLLNVAWTYYLSYGVGTKKKSEFKAVNDWALPFIVFDDKTKCIKNFLVSKTCLSCKDFFFHIRLFTLHACVNMIDKQKRVYLMHLLLMGAQYIYYFY